MAPSLVDRRCCANMCEGGLRMMRLKVELAVTSLCFLVISHVWAGSAALIFDPRSGRGVDCVDEVFRAVFTPEDRKTVL